MAILPPLASEKIVRIALIGNPNTGKTTIFNNLTGLRQRVGNYPGVTVAKKSGLLKLRGGNIELIDLPGAYSLSAASLDERIVVDSLCGRMASMEAPDVVACVIDASNLLRNLFLASQVAELGIPMILILNQCDVARRKDIQINDKLLSARLGIPVVRAVATRQEGTEEILTAIDSVLGRPRRMKAIEWPGPVKEATELLQQAIDPDRRENINDTEIHRILFDADSAVLERLENDTEEVRLHIGQARGLLFKAGYNPMAAEPLLQYEHLGRLIEGVVTHPGTAKTTRTESIDQLMVHRGWGLAIFIGMMYLVFLSVYTWASPFMDAIQNGIGWLQGNVGPLFAATPMLQSLMVDGVIEGVGAFLGFLPQIMILFFFIALLEDTGYMARAAFLMDKMFSWCGLNGKSFVPLLSSYACAVPGIMATRTIEDPKARLATILIAPFMSCSARLPVYVLLIGAFIEPVYGSFYAGLALFFMHFVGLAVAIPTAFILNRFLLKTRPQPFLLELPAYRVPRLRDIAWRMYQSGAEFVRRAGTIIFAITIIVWALLYFPRPASVEEEIRQNFIQHQGVVHNTTPEAIQTRLAEENSNLADELERLVDSTYLEQSFMGRIGKTLQPLFAPAGFDWKITVGVLASFPAREVVISTLGVIYSLGGDVDEETGDLRQAVANAKWSRGDRVGTPVYIMPVVVGILVFFALCSQCGATLAIITKEAGFRWAALSFTFMTSMAWLGAVLCYQIGIRLF